MKCQEVQQLLCELVDCELEEEARRQVREHLDACAACRAAGDEALSLKRLVQAKAFRPTIPGGLAGRALRLARETAARPPAAFAWRRRVWGAFAAALLLAACAWLLREFWRPQTPPRLLAHARFVEDVTAQFEKTDAVPPTMAQCVDFERSEPDLLEEIHRRTGVLLEKIPRIDKACLIAYRRTAIRGRLGVRFDYLDECARNKKCPRSVISIFAIPLQSVGELPSELATDLRLCVPCEWIEVNNLTVYCFRDRRNALNLVSWVDAPKLQPRIQLEEPRGE